MADALAGGASDPEWGPTRHANCPRGLGRLVPPHIRMPLSPAGYSGAAVIPEARAVGVRSSHRRVARPFRNPYGPGFPRGTGDGVGLSPVSVDCHCVQAKPPATLSSHDASRVASREQRLRDAAVLRQASELGTSTWAET